METISRREAFDCAVALSASVINVLNEGKDKSYDYALILLKGSSSPIVCLKPGDYPSWNQLGDVNQEKTFAFLPIGNHFVSECILSQCGTDHEYYERSVSFEKFNAYQHPCPWIKETLAKQYLKLSYMGDMLWDNTLVYDSSFISKTHSTWICAKVDGGILYFPYYTPSERQRAFCKLPSDFYTKMTQEYWEDHSSY